MTGICGGGAMSVRYYLRNITIRGRAKYMSVINEEKLNSEFLLLPNKFYIYVLVYRKEVFKRLLGESQVSWQLLDLNINLNCCHKNIAQSLFDDLAINKFGSLMEIKTETYEAHQRMLKLLQDNSNNYNTFSYNPQSVHMPFAESMRWSIKKHSKEHRFQIETLLNKWIEVKFKNGVYKITKVYEEENNILTKLPILSFDLEVVCKNETAFPLGVFPDEQISSCSIILKYNNISYNIIFVLAPWENYSVDNTTRYLKQQLKTEYVLVFAFKTEFELLQQLFAALYSGCFLKLFHLPTYTVHIITGYNINNFDIPYLYKRLRFYGLAEWGRMLNLTTGWRQNFNIDVFVLEKKFCGITLGSNYKLNNVAAIFLGEKKVDLQILKLRKLYKASNIDPNSISETTTIDGDAWVPTINYSLYYNVIDSDLVTRLIDKQDFLNLLFLQSCQYNKALEAVQNQGNSQLLASMINLFLINNDFFFNKTPPHLVFPRMREWVECDAADYSRMIDIIKYNDEHVIDLKYNLTNFETYKKEDTIKQASDDDTYTDVVTFDDMPAEEIFAESKGFGGGANAAIPGGFLSLASVDFTSLYPSIIAGFQLDFNNVCVLTKRQLQLKCGHYKCPVESLLQYCHVYVYDQDESIESFLINIENRTELTAEIDTIYKFNKLDVNARLIIILSKRKSILFDLVTHLLERRAFYKKQQGRMAKSQELMWKQIACSLFGVLGFAYFESGAYSTAAAVTHLARRLITTVAILLHRRRYRTLYIDTDGIIILYSGTNDDLQVLTDDITADLNRKHIHLKAEDTYPIGLILSKKKYILLTSKSKLIIKGWIKNAIKPIKDICEKWFLFLFKHIQAKAAGDKQTWQVNFNYVELVVACYCELEALWNRDVQEYVANGDITIMGKWQHGFKINKKSPVFKTAAFSEELNQKYNISEDGDRVYIYKLVDFNNLDKFIYVDDHTVDLTTYRCDVKSIFKNYIQYVINSTFTPRVFKINNDEVNEMYARRRIMFDELHIDITFT
jgi:DNA polymerase elongation subunit (family B)